MKSPAERRHRATFQNPGPPMPDGEGGFVLTWTDLVPPAAFVAIEPATAASLERHTANTVASTATHLVFLPFHRDVTTQTRMLFDGRRFSVLGVQDPELAHAELVLTVAELVT